MSHDAIFSAWQHGQPLCWGSFIGDEVVSAQYVVPATARFSLMAMSKGATMPYAQAVYLWSATE